MDSYFSRLDQAADYLVIFFQTRAPKKSGTLALLGIRKAYDAANGYPIIVIGGEPASYAIYTNEPWISKRWNGRLNPHQGWIQMAIEEARGTLIAILSGSMTMEDYNRLMTESAASLQAQFNDLTVA